MRILILNSEFPPIGGGAGNASANLAREFVSGGHEVTVLTSAFDSLPREETRDGFRIVRIAALRRRVDRSGALEQGFFALAASASILGLVPRWKPDVIIAFFGVPAGPVALLATWVFRTPYLVSLRGGDVPGFRPYDFGTYHKIIAPLLRLIWKHAAAIVANSGGLRTLALNFEHRFPIQIIPNGVDVGRFTPPSGREWALPQLLFVGRLVHQKGLDLLLPALAQLQQLPWELVIIGDGPQREPLQQMAAELGLAERIRFAGWQRGADLEAEYQHANLFVLPSRHEGMPNVVLEAMASGLPVLATRIAGNEELVLPGETGELVPPENSAALQSALEHLLPDASLRQRMGKAGRARVEAHFSWASAARQYLSLMESARGKA
jgi:glycosyltransferase involved in cell wall biosynthesis